MPHSGSPLTSSGHTSSASGLRVTAPSLTPQRDPSSGYRSYAPNTVRTVRFIREAQGLGFTLKEISDLLRLRNDTRASCTDVRAAAKAKLDDVERRIKQLRAVRSALRKLIDTCRSDGLTRACPILEALTDGDDDDASKG